MLDPIYYGIAAAIGSLATLLLCIGGIVAYAKFRTYTALLLMIGSILLLLSNGFQLIGPIIASRLSSEAVVRVSAYTSLTYGFSSLVFGIGLILFVISLKKLER